MMVPPDCLAQANQHWCRLQSLSRQDWQDTLHATPYTKVLKNLVVELMAKREVDANKSNSSYPPEPKTERTYCLYRKARDLYDKFRVVKDEGKDTVTVVDVQSVQRMHEQMAAGELEDLLQQRADMLDDLENSNRFTERLAPPTSLDLLVEEIEQVCDEVDKEAHDTRFNPRMVDWVSDLVF